MLSKAQQQRVIMFVGASGSGKSTTRKMLSNSSEFKTRFVVSSTTRKLRSGEVNDVDYHFITQEQFNQELNAGMYLETNRYVGNNYGMLLSEFNSLEDSEFLLLEIEMEGIKNVKRYYPYATSIYIRVASPSILKQRLKQRKGTTPEDIAKRMDTLKTFELAYRNNEFNYVITTDSKEYDT